MQGLGTGLAIACTNRATEKQSISNKIKDFNLKNKQEEKKNRKWKKYIKIIVS